MARLRNRVIVAAILLVILGHPFLLGLPGRIGATAFQHVLHVGMKRRDIIKFARLLGGGVDAPKSLDNVSSGAPGVMNVTFLTVITLCYSDQRQFNLAFNPAWQLIKWDDVEIGSAC